MRRLEASRATVQQHSPFETDHAPQNAAPTSPKFCCAAGALWEPSPAWGLCEITFTHAVPVWAGATGLGLGPAEAGAAATTASAAADSSIMSGFMASSGARTRTLQVPASDDRTPGSEGRPWPGLTPAGPRQGSDRDSARRARRDGRRDDPRPVNPPCLA